MPRHNRPCTGSVLSRESEAPDGSPGKFRTLRAGLSARAGASGGDREGWGFPARRDAGGSRTHFNRVAAGRLAVGLQRPSDEAMSSPGIEPGLRPSRSRVRVRHTPRTSSNSNPPPGNRTRPCGFEDRRAPDTLAGSGRYPGRAKRECPRQESNLVCDLRRVACCPSHPKGVFAEVPGFKGPASFQSFHEFLCFAPLGRRFPGFVD
jgi:hypothetical protein